MTFIYERAAIPEKTVVQLLLENARDVYCALKALSFREYCVFDVSRTGLRIIVNDQNCVQAIAYLKSELFVEYFVREDVVTFRIPVHVLMECLNAFGAGISSVLKMTYDGYGEPLKVMVEKHGIVVRCLIVTQNPEAILDFDFNPVDIAVKIMMKPWKIKETFHDLDQSSSTVVIKVDKHSLVICTEGELGKVKTEFPLYSDQIERLECNHDVISSYRMNLLKKMIHSLDICDKLSLRIDRHGMLSIQFLIEHSEDNHIFLEFFCVSDFPSEENDSSGVTL